MAKEYICKDELINHFFFGVDEEEAREENQGEIITFEDIDRLQTVTQADIVKEFAEALKNKIEVNYCRGDLTRQYVGMQVEKWIDEQVKEMEN